jgi:hypothetical protein
MSFDPTSCDLRVAALVNATTEAEGDEILALEGLGPLILWFCFDMGGLLLVFVDLEQAEAGGMVWGVGPEGGGGGFGGRSRQEAANPDAWGVL